MAITRTSTESVTYHADTFEDMVKAAEDCGAIPDTNPETVAYVPMTARYLTVTTWGGDLGSGLAVGTITYLDENLEVLRSFTV